MKGEWPIWGWSGVRFATYADVCISCVMPPQMTSAGFSPVLSVKSCLFVVRDAWFLLLSLLHAFAQLRDYFANAFFSVGASC